MSSLDNNEVSTKKTYSGEIERVVSGMLFTGTPRGTVIAEMIAVLRELVTTSEIVLLSEDAEGELAGLAIGNKHLIEHVIDFAQAEYMEYTHVAAPDREGPRYQ